MMGYVHQRFLQQFVEQDVVGHMESELDDEDVDLGAASVLGLLNWQAPWS